MKSSVLWGAIVGVALGVTCTFALARGVLVLPWTEGTAEASEVQTPAVPRRSLELDVRTSERAIPSVPPRRPLRPAATTLDELAVQSSAHTVDPLRLSRS